MDDVETWFPFHHSVNGNRADPLAAHCPGSEDYGPRVVTGKGAACAEALPAASKAATVKAYRVLAESPVMDTDVPAGEATSVPSRYTR